MQQKQTDSGGLRISGVSTTGYSESSVGAWDTSGGIHSVPQTVQQTRPQYHREQSFQTQPQQQLQQHQQEHHQQHQAITTGANSHSLIGQERIVSVSSRVDESRAEVMSETIREKTIRVPKRIVHEEVIERVVVIPEIVQREEIIDEYQTVQEKIIEIAKPIIQEKVIEVPEYLYIDKIVEVPEIVRQEKIRHVNKMEYKERIVEVPNIITQERIVEIPQYEYHDRVIEKLVEVPEVHEQIITKQVPITQYIDQPIPEYVEVEEPYAVSRNLPIPVEASTVFEYLLPKYTRNVTKVKYPVYVPRFLEVPVAEELFNNTLLTDMQKNRSHVGLLSTMKQAVSLCELENLALNVKQTDIDHVVASSSLKEALQEAWAKGTVNILSDYERIGTGSTKQNHSELMNRE